MTSRILLLLAVSAVFPGAAQADIVFSLVPTAGPTYDLGDTVTIDLVATDPDTNEVGNIWTGFQARITATTADPNDAGVQMTGPKFIFLGGAGTTDDFNTADGRTFIGIGNTSPFVSGDVLASFSYIASEAGTTSFGYNTSTDGFNSANFSVGVPFTPATGLSLVGTSVTVNAAAVPEPSSFALVGIAGAVVGYRRRRLKKTAA